MNSFRDLSFRSIRLQTQMNITANFSRFLASHHRIAKRFNNQKRTYLLVNPLQAKHIPVSPKASLGMMKALGDMLANKYPDTKLVIGFAETATAIGAVVAESFSSKCVYIHTTRENVSGVVQWVQFMEEHSHATEQSLVGDNLSAWISATDSVVFVDDERRC